MKKFLFSKSHKKHYSETVVRMGKNNMGFSLVELIIVIAIMAILAAVAIPVFGAFIKKAEKSNDQNVVKDIVYAIELANKAGVFENDSMAISNFEYPIAFIVINKNGTQVLTSGTSTVKATSECESETITVSYAEPDQTTVKCKKHFLSCDGVEVTKYNPKQGVEITYCKTHSSPAVLQMIDSTVDGSEGYPEYPAQYNEVNCSNTSYLGGCNEDFAVTVGSNLNISGWQNFVSDYVTFDKSIIKMVDGQNYCTFYELASNMESQGTAVPDRFVGNNISVPNDVNDPVYQALEDVFGSTFTTDLKLTSADWAAGENITYASLYTSAPALFDDVQNLSDKLVTFTGLLSEDLLTGTVGMKKKYTSESEIMTEFAADFITLYGPDVTNASGETVDSNGRSVGLNLWIEQWNNVAGILYTDGGFGFSNREQYSACRFGYNSAFASYLETCGIDSKYTVLIKDFYRDFSKEEGMSSTVMSVASLAGLNFPALANANAFDNNDSGLKQAFINVDSENGEAVFEQVEELYDKYVTSAACEANAIAFYDSIVTVDDTHEIAEGSGDFYGYYEGYLEEMSSLYGDAQALAGGTGVMIIVYVKNGVATCDITPAAADFRNQ